MKKKYIGVNFDEFLKEESLLEHSTDIADSRILAWKNEWKKREQSLTKPSTTKKISANCTIKKSKGIRNP